MTTLFWHNWIHKTCIIGIGCTRWLSRLESFCCCSACAVRVMYLIWTYEEPRLMTSGITFANCVARRLWYKIEGALSQRNVRCGEKDPQRKSPKFRNFYPELAWCFGAFLHNNSIWIPYDAWGRIHDLERRFWGTEISQWGPGARQAR